MSLQPGHNADEPRVGSDTTVTPVPAAVCVSASTALRRADCGGHGKLRQARGFAVQVLAFDLQPRRFDAEAPVVVRPPAVVRTNPSGLSVAIAAAPSVDGALSTPPWYFPQTRTAIRVNPVHSGRLDWQATSTPLVASDDSGPVGRNVVRCRSAEVGA
ncbi:hypothetical protein [Rhodococcus sp. IEGM 1379]|uniref:hypothetical protein n=1 Tax=Rhodococcus sp. IEGM 1379 TaxID=3047086 RepID=UPI0024B657E9|nr:hypothetical protein [Rhodococcus sp. IEGM 1379]MDI9915694.1 hypothetical protein [Rhodococcus sp. IEGM 1379]